MSEATILTRTGSGQTGTGSGSNLISQIARIVGGESEPNVRAHALDCLNRVKNELNQHDWRFMKRTQAAITFINGTATYNLDASYRKPSFAHILDSTGKLYAEIIYKDDAAFSHQKTAQTDTGLPIYYTLRNEFEDGYITVYPIPDSSTATNYQMMVEYFARIPTMADNSDQLSLPEEVLNVLVAGGQAYITRERQKESPVIPVLFGDYQRSKSLLMSNDRRFSDEMPRFRIRGSQYQPFGTMLIKV